MGFPILVRWFIESAPSGKFSPQTTIIDRCVKLPWIFPGSPIDFQWGSQKLWQSMVAQTHQRAIHNLVTAYPITWLILYIYPTYKINMTGRMRHHHTHRYSRVLGYNVVNFFPKICMIDTTYSSPKRARYAEFSSSLCYCCRELMIPLGWARERVRSRGPHHFLDKRSHCFRGVRKWSIQEGQMARDSLSLNVPWTFPEAPLKVNGAPGNIQGNLDRLCGVFCEFKVWFITYICHCCVLYSNM